MTTDVATAVASLKETTYTYDRPQGTSLELDIPSPRSWAGERITGVLIMFICVLAFIANLVMLICLLVYKQATRKTVNIFVCNQTILDLIASSFSVTKLALVMSGYLHTKTGVLRIFKMKFFEDSQFYTLLHYTYRPSLLVDFTFYEIFRSNGNMQAYETLRECYINRICER